MGATGEQLLEAIRRNRGDVALVFIYADWLEEHGRELEANAVRMRKRVGKVCDPPNSPYYFYGTAPAGNLVASGGGASWISHHLPNQDWDGIGSGVSPFRSVSEEPAGDGEFASPRALSREKGSGSGDHHLTTWAKEGMGSGFYFGYEEIRPDHVGTGCGVTDT